MRSEQSIHVPSQIGGTPPGGGGSAVCRPENFSVREGGGTPAVSLQKFFSKTTGRDLLFFRLFQGRSCRGGGRSCSVVPISRAPPRGGGGYPGRAGRARSPYRDMYAPEASFVKFGAGEEGSWV